MYGRIPFNAPNVFKLFQLVQTEELRFPEDVTTSAELKDLLTRMLAKVCIAPISPVDGFCSFVLKHDSNALG